MPGKVLLPIGSLALLLCTPLAANEQEYHLADEFTTEAETVCDYWASVSEVSADEYAEYVEQCVIDEISEYQAYPLSIDVPESFNVATSWK